jgi:hypothetical protein
MGLGNIYESRELSILEKKNVFYIRRSSAPRDLAYLSVAVTPDQISFALTTLYHLDRLCSMTGSKEIFTDGKLGGWVWK